MKQLLIVFIGGGLGSALRYGVSRLLNPILPAFPLGTLSVNIAGSLLIGMLLGMSLKGNALQQDTLLFLAVGFCGGFTTFSAFAYENYAFLKNGELLNFSLYTIGSLIIGFIAVFIGVWIGRLF